MSLLCAGGFGLVFLNRLPPQERPLSITAVDDVSPAKAALAHSSG